MDRIKKHRLRPKRGSTPYVPENYDMARLTHLTINNDGKLLPTKLDKEKK